MTTLDIAPAIQPSPRSGTAASTPNAAAACAPPVQPLAHATDTVDATALRLAHLFRRVSASQMPHELQRALYTHRGVTP